MAQLTMAVLVINMGGEMVYIIDQRLRAQNIPTDKMLEEVTATMFSTKFIDEMFKPHQLQSLETLQQIFRRLAHSSIMRLNEPSMEKLYDLMTMGFKYQLIASASPGDVIQITRNHLNSLIQLFPVASRQCIAVSLIQRTLAIFEKMFGSVADWQLAILRQRLLDVLQDRKIKVSLLLQSNLQDVNGNIIVPSNRPGPITDALGTVRIFSSSSLVQTQILSELTRPNSKTASVSASIIGCALGSNIYENEVRPQPSPPTPSSEPAATPAPSTKKPPIASAPLPPLMDSLADLIKVAPIDPMFKLDLDLVTGDPWSGSNSRWSGGATQRIVADPVMTKADILSDLNDADADDSQTSGGEIDLLALMDALPPE